MARQRRGVRKCEWEHVCSTKHSDPYTLHCSTYLHTQLWGSSLAPRSSLLFVTTLGAWCSPPDWPRPNSESEFNTFSLIGVRFKYSLIYPIVEIKMGKMGGSWSISACGKVVVQSKSWLWICYPVSQEELRFCFIPPPSFINQTHCGCHAPEHMEFMSFCSSL